LSMEFYISPRKRTISFDAYQLTFDCGLYYHYMLESYSTT
jgi:hypothetical protein